MKTTIINAWLGCCLVFGLSEERLVAQGTAFTYQGRLEQDGVPVNQDYCFIVRLFESLAGGDPIGPTLEVDHIDVVNGLFSLELDFAQQFAAGGDRYLDLQIMDDDNCLDLKNLVQLAPRQRISASPRALHAATADVAVQAESAGLAEHAGFADLANVARRLDAPDGSPTSAVFVDNNGNVGMGTANPETKLHIKGHSEAIRIDGSSVGAPSGAYVSFGDAAGTPVGYVGDGGSGDTNVFLASYLSDVALITPAGRVLTAKSGGNVGIGTTTPAAKLDVRGDVKLGSTGQLFATAGEENLRIVRGRVSSAGARLSGSGFTSARVGTGDYTITFDPPFAATPVVTANAEWITAQLNLTSTGMALVQGNNASTASIVMVSRWDGSELVNRGFHFIAIGPR